MTDNELSRLVALYTRQICTHNEILTWLREGHGLDSDSGNGGEWSRRYADKLVEAAIPIQHRVQESGEVQRDIRHDRSSSWAWKAAANCLSKDEP